MAPGESRQGQPKGVPDATDRAHEEADVPEEASTNPPGTGSDDTAAAEERAHRTDELFTRMGDGDAGARDALIERFLPLARQLARRYQRAAEPLDDLVQVASIGLVKGVDRFDAARGVAFSSYAVPTILGELKRYFRDSGWAVHVPRGMQERAMQVDRAIKELAGRLGRSPSVDEVAEHTHTSVEEVLSAMEAGQAYEAVSLDSERGSSPEAGAETVADGIGATDERFELVEYGASIAPAVKALSDRDRLILHLRFVEDLTQSQIADRIGVSQMQISRLIRRSLARLRAAAAE
jgi:RNA polymerase sigma-B factor